MGSTRALLMVAALAGCTGPDRAEDPALNPPTETPRRDDVEPAPTVDAEPGWAWVQAQGSGEQVSHAYGPWSAEGAAFECLAPVFSGTATSSVICRRFRAESRLWRVEVEGQAHASDVLIDGDTVFVVWTLDGGCEVRALELQTGAPMWTTPLDCRGIVQLQLGEGTIEVHDGRGVSHALEQGSGEVVASSRLPEALLWVKWRDDEDAATDGAGRSWRVEGQRLVRSDGGVDRRLPMRSYRTDETIRVSWTLDATEAGVAVHERVDLPLYAMRWTHLYGPDGALLGTRRIISGLDHPGLWELQVVPERTLPAQ